MTQRQSVPLMAVMLVVELASADVKGSRADEKAVRDVLAQAASTWNVHDMRAHCALMAADADFVNVNGWWWQGREEIERQHATAHQTVFKSSQAEVLPKKIRFMTLDVAVIQASWRVTGDTRSKNPRDYIMTYVMRRQGGRWLIIAGQNASAEDRSISAPVNLSTAASFGDPDERSAKDVPAEQVAIGDVLKEVDQAWSNGDIKAAARFYATDADLVDPKARWFQGRTQVEQHLADLRSGVFNKAERTSQVAKVRFVHADVAVVNERWRISAASGDQASVRGMGLLVMARQQGAWRIVTVENTITRGNPPAQSPR